ncbi:hypothetical protein [Agrococcus sp. ProA11]|uniref:arsenate reductase/protein-tyrosine-phosphatase family protein n=1 Tax=Agrococcus chionoecetis TaxID=3153752 RepID=UPI0032600093
MSAPDGGILVVCTANVCRSPMAEFALRRGFGQRAGLDGVAVASAGVRVAEERSACAEVIAFRDEPAWAQMGSKHRARALEPSMIRAAALVVTATREQRSSVVAAAPEMRGVVFTLREALWLGNDYERGDSTPAPRAVAAFREHIHGMRGLRPLPTQARRRFWRAGPDPLDIPDGHGGGARDHHAAMRAALAAGNQLAELIGGRGS